MQIQELARVASAALIAGGASVAVAISPPDQAQVSFKAMNYQDRQDQVNRIGVKALSTHWVLPLGGAWSIEAGTVVDTISGASPAYYTSPSSFAAVHDKRQAQDVRAAYHWDNQRIALGQGRSKEVDYLSRSHVLLYTRSTPDNNTTVDLGTAYTQDTINPVNRLVVDERKAVREFLVGVTQVFSPQDLVQWQWVHTRGHGYYSDPYKLLDARPDVRRIDALGVRWNHHMPGTQTTARWHVRAASDTFGIRSGSLGLELARVLTPQWTVTPSARFYSQSSAIFFSPPHPDRPDRPYIPELFVLGQSHISFDQRLAAYGALTWGVKLERKISSNSWVDVKYERYRQRNAWALHGAAVQGLADFNAQFIQVGLTYKFGP